MKSAEYGARILAGLGSYAAAAVVLLYVLLAMTAALPDGNASSGRIGLLVGKAFLAGLTAIALFAGAFAPRAALIIGGCLLFIVDFPLLLAMDSLRRYPTLGPIRRGALADPSGPVLTVLLVWVVFPVLTMLLAIVWTTGRRRVDRVAAAGAERSRLAG